MSEHILYYHSQNFRRVDSLASLIGDIAVTPHCLSALTLESAITTANLKVSIAINFAKMIFWRRTRFSQMKNCGNLMFSPATSLPCVANHHRVGAMLPQFIWAQSRPLDCFQHTTFSPKTWWTALYKVERWKSCVCCGANGTAHAKRNLRRTDYSFIQPIWGGWP